MPTVVKEFPAAKKQCHSKYEPYCDGRVWKFTKADLRQLGVKSFDILRNQFYSRARTVRGRRARVGMRGGALFVQVLTAAGSQQHRLKISA